MIFYVYLVSHWCITRYSQNTTYFFCQNEILETQHPFMQRSPYPPRFDRARRIAMLETGLPPWKNSSWLRSERWSRNERQRPFGVKLGQLGWEGDGEMNVRMQICFLGCVRVMEFMKVYVILVHDLDNLIVWKYGSTRFSMTSESITNYVFKWNSTLPRIVLLSFSVMSWFQRFHVMWSINPLARRWLESGPVR